jgi:hypothetical protein
MRFPQAMLLKNNPWHTSNMSPHVVHAAWLKQSSATMEPRVELVPTKWASMDLTIIDVNQEVCITFHSTGYLSFCL